MAPKTRTGPRNPEIAKGIRQHGRSAAISKTGRFRFVKKGKDAKKKEVAVKKAAPVAEKKFYEADDLPRPRRTIKHKVTVAKLRSTITPGTVLVLLAGRFRGRRVVFLKQLASGLLLVTGPFEINGVPLRRVNQSYVIATSTKVDISKVAISASIDDKYFAKVEDPGQDKESEFFKQGKASPVKVEWLQKRKAEQAKVDAAVSAAVKAVPHLKTYLGSRFSLTNGQAPHAMAF